MRTFLILIDTLKRDYLKIYNEKSDVKTPNIDKLSEDCLCFDRHFVGSTPCMPARRDILTGRYNFLERSWGPIEAYDNTFVKILSEKNIYTHLVTDHTHYFRIGGEGYINQYNTWDFQRGQEGDPWVSRIEDPDFMPDKYYGKLRRQYQLNRTKWQNDADMYPTPRTFQSAMEFVEENKNQDDYFLQVEVFDPHEPFDVPDEYLELYTDKKLDRYFETPLYNEVDVPDEALEYIKNRYKALLTMTDFYLGKFIDKLKKLNIYDDSLIILTSDHGFLLGEKGLLGKNYPHHYNELALIPLLIKDPDMKRKGERTKNLSQNVDLFNTILDYYNINSLNNNISKSLKPVFDYEDNQKRFALYGMHGSTVNVCDGKYTYLKAPNKKNKPLYEYSTSLSTIRGYLGSKNPKEVECGHFLNSTDYPVYKIPVNTPSQLVGLGDLSKFISKSHLYDIENDYNQQYDIMDYDMRLKYDEFLKNCLIEVDAPKEQLERLDLV